MGVSFNFICGVCQCTSSAKCPQTGKADETVCPTSASTGLVLVAQAVRQIRILRISPANRNSFTACQGAMYEGINNPMAWRIRNYLAYGIIACAAVAGLWGAEHHGQVNFGGL